MSDLPQVGIDARGLDPSFKSHAGRGIGRYLDSLGRALVKLDTGRRVRFLVDATAKPPAWLAAEPDRIRRVSSPSWPDRLGREGVHLRQHLVWPRVLRSVPFDLVHFGSQTDAPAFGSRPDIVTVLDLIPHRMAEQYRVGKSRLRYATGRWLERRALRRARGLLAISETTKRDLLSLLGVPEERVRVTLLGVDPAFVPAPPGAIEALRRRLRLEPGYLLYVGGIDARKNLGLVLQVLAALTAEREGVELVLAGRHRDDPGFPALVARIRELGLEDAVRLVGPVTDEELPALYSGAGVFLFPSLYEGFGLPPLEAMACGAPVVAARRTALPEVLGDAALLVDPDDVAGFVAATRTLLDDRDRRAAMVAAGVRRASRFRWEDTARRTLDAYAEFASMAGP